MPESFLRKVGAFASSPLFYSNSCFVEYSGLPSGLQLCSQSVAHGCRWSLVSDSIFPFLLILDDFPHPLATHWYLISNTVILALNSSSDIYYSAASEYR